MYQLSFLSISESDTQKNSIASEWTLYIDGAARNNPGPAGAGIFITHNNNALCKEGYFLGRKTNNQAEYLALLVGLHYIQAYLKPGQALSVLSDSLLLVRQMAGLYKVRHADLIPLHHVGILLSKKFNTIFKHIPRERNSEADAAANMGIDKQIPLPAAFRQMMQAYELFV